ncbi:chorion peroxidase-like [Leptopilina heterotoma]|uniref:chorion peroxidase-like n=1 Tax=Leptopilina heterotoma TaxID=63436 RepID=UPI001CAA2CF9|nr:chorion peroxidase-like [Leptopilina heterotoma]
MDYPKPHPECLPIAVHSRDKYLSRFGVTCLEFLRNGPAPRENCEFGPREQFSQVTSFLDASTIYGSNVVHSDSLRIFRDGLVKYGKLQNNRNLATKDNSDICQLGSLSQSCFIAGDGRVGENPALTSLHVVFLRLHNKIATQIAIINPHWSEEKMFQETRKIVGAIIQHITYREFLPIVLGHDVMKDFKLDIMMSGYFDEYDSTTNPNVINEFATAAFRFGHSLVQPIFARFDKNNKPLFSNVSIHEEFVNHHLHSEGSLERIILGLVNQPSQRRDEFISEELTNHLFQRESFPFGMDLAAINIQRGRDHGLPPYFQYRSICGLSEINNWEDLERVIEKSTVQKFKLLYSSVEDIDLFSAGLAEKSLNGGLVGPTFACIIAQQFSNLKNGDRFWFENSNVENKFTPEQLTQIRSTTLTQVLCQTIENIESIQPFVMLLPDNFKNQRMSCHSSKIGNINVNAWLELTPGRINKAQVKENFQWSRESISKPQIKSTSEQKVRQFMKPLQSSINQQNRIVLKRPIAPQKNISIIVQNTAVNAPVFVKDSVYEPHIIQEPDSLFQLLGKKPNSLLDPSNIYFYPNKKTFLLRHYKTYIP